MRRNQDKFLQEAFGDAIGMYAGNAPEGVRSMQSEGICPDCGMMPIDGKCACEAPQGGVCPKCGMMPIDGDCDCSAQQPVQVSAVKSGCSCGSMSQAMCQCGY